ncbi:chemotaxis protein CheA [uncultured Croceicoccus sp.]|uniref:chemotaxis protein CheA n=1 Tax=uncultured Croceicoccus sp. TaxID=1295329 RepID=UPI00261E30FB|nr:chemotaxis protein CheA [uncultured Croceicoccus sp.]
MSEQGLPDPTATFRIEAADVLNEVEQALLDLTERPGDRNLIDAVFRGLHTLKGSGAMFGFDALAGFTHHCESAFDQVRKGAVAATPELISIVLNAQDRMRALVDGNVDEERQNAIIAQLTAAVEAASGDAGDGVDIADVPSLAQAEGWRVMFRLPPECMANGTNPLFLLDELRDLGECEITASTDKLPSLAELDPRECHIGWDVVLRGAIDKDDIEDVFIFVMDDMELSIEPLASQVTDDTAAEDGDPPAAPTPEEAGASAQTTGTDGRTTSGKPANDTLRVPAERLDELMDRVGQLVIAQSRLSQIAHSDVNLALRSVSEEIERLSGELRDTMMVLRMVPVSTLFGRFRRLVHDLSQETGKAITLTTDGEGTEVDKTVIERLFDPLVHIIRNSCDHGLELPEERIAAGKPESGNVTLCAHQAGGEVVITIRDDGRGIDRNRVRAKAEENGLIKPDQVLSDQELLQLIFHPGFSTAAKVSNLSGRGVGMDVVKRTIDSLRGTIEVASEPGAGSTIALRIPLTLAIIEGLLVRVSEERYVIPLSSVEECIELSLEDDLRHRGRSLISLRGALVPFLRLRELFASTKKPDRFQKIIVVSTGSERVGLVVDQIIGNHQTVIKSMSAFHRGVASFAGATILGDGTVALILDVPQLVALTQNREERLQAAG